MKRLVGFLCVVMFLFFFKAWPTQARDPQRLDNSEYEGAEACRECHEGSFQRFKSTRMGKIFLSAPRSVLEEHGCEACHGPGRVHAEMERQIRAGERSRDGDTEETILRFGKKSSLGADTQNGQCFQCHEKGILFFWRGSPHDARGLACVNCHEIHQKMQPALPGSRFVEALSTNRQFVKDTQMQVCFQCHKMRRAQLMRSSHMPFREGKVSCTSCHNPHGSPNPKLLLEASVNETCYRCHAERRGPFLWEHPPVMENCLNCHDAHGSSHPQLLKSRTPRLCQRCHIEARHPTTPQLAASRFAFNRSCTNCHSQIHGSNHPAGVRFHR